MKALTVRQPYATLIVLGVKRMETRPRPIRYRGPIAIHAGASTAGHGRRGTVTRYGPYTVVHDLSGLLLRGPGLAWSYRLPLGAILGTVEVFNCRATTSGEHAPSDIERSLGDHSPGRHAWHLTPLGRFPRPIPARGQLGLWTWGEVAS